MRRESAKRSNLKLSTSALLTCSILLFSVGTLYSGLFPLHNANAATSDPCATALPISKITASASSTNSPNRAIDGNSKTYWNSVGKGSWIKPDLGKQQTVCYVDIDWYGGNTRIYNFAISISNDGSTWVNVYTGSSDGKTVSYERFDFGDIDARWVKITTNGNQVDLRNSIQELKVRGHAVTTPPPDPDPTPSTTVPYRAMVLPYISVDSQRAAYSELKSYDMVVLRVGAGTTPSSTHLALVRELPAQIKGLEFRSISEITNFIQSGNKDKITFIGYVPEPEHGTPQAEIDNIVQSVRQASSIVHNAGLKFELVPRLQHNLDHAADFAPYVDYYTIMGQSRQDQGVATFQAFINGVASDVRSTNPGIELMFAEVSTERSPSPGLTLQETFRQCTASVVPATVNGGSVWFNTLSQLQEVNNYLDWYDVTYVSRAL